MKQIVLGRVGEITLKGLNRPRFEKALRQNIRRALKDIPALEVKMEKGRFYVEHEGDQQEVIERLRRVFGVVSLSPVYRVPPQLEAIREKALLIMQECVREGKKVFKVQARRAKKDFPHGSLELNHLVGAHILRNIPGLKVDVHNPEVTIHVEVRENAYVYGQIIPGPGGLPTGTAGKAMLLLSGGIDSPVAGYLIMKRGVVVEGVHFYSFPFTGEKSLEKVIDLARILATYQGKFKLHVIHFTEIQKAIFEHCPEEYFTIIMRRMMMRIANRLCTLNGGKALVTGESLGQVASQTMESIMATEEVAEFPVYRPLIGMDKMEIIALAEKIGTYKTSILPYEDCCTVFVPRHPKTRPRLEKVHAAEKDLPVEPLLTEALPASETLFIMPEGVQKRFPLLSRQEEEGEEGEEE